VNKERALTNKINPVRETDDDARALARRLLEEAKYGALGVKEVESSVPLVSRVAAAWSKQTGLFFSASDLSVHSKCLIVDGLCSIMLGEPGKGDGLAYPRITIIGHSQRLPNTHDDYPAMKAVFLKHHPKAALYVDFADFGFYPFRMDRALLNGGFGKAYHLNSSDLV